MKKPHDKPKDLTSTFKERSSTHGDFAENALITVQIRKLYRETGNWSNLVPEQQLALDEIALKIARILSEGSEPGVHWHDLQGYAKLAEDADV